MKNRNNNRAEVRLVPSDRLSAQDIKYKRDRFDVQIYGGDTDELLSEDNFLGWGGLRLRNYLLLSGVNHVRYMDAETLSKAGLC